MNALIARLMLAAAAAIFAFGAVMHATAYWVKASAGIDGSNLPPFLGAELKVLWLADSTTLLALAVVFGFIAAKPASAARPVITLVALVPAGTTVLLYLLLAAATAMVVIAALLMPASGPGS